MEASALALASALAFAINAICTRRGALWAPPSHGVRLSLLVAFPAFGVAAVMTGQTDVMFHLRWYTYVLFGGVGLLHFVAGRALNYLAIREIGAARSIVVIGVYPLITVPLAVIIFGESLSWPIVAGAVLIMSGPVLFARSEGASFRALRGTARSDLVRGLGFALGAAVFFGITPILVKGAFRDENVPFLGIFLAYGAAMLIMGVQSANPKALREFVTMDRRGLSWYLAAAVAVSAAQALNFLALSEGQVTVVTLLLQTVPLFVLLLTILVNQTVEVINGSVIAGSLLLVIGSAVVASAQ